jgi:thiamine-phosphate pyrophosphorylase
VRSPADALLYGIIDLGYVSPENAPGILEKLIAGGIDMVQLRGKNYTIDELSSLAEKLLQLTTPAEIPLIANDHAQIAQRVDVQGVHVGQDGRIN